MSFFAVFVALLLEQARPLGENNAVHRWWRGWSTWVVRSVDAGQSRQGWLAWSLACVLPTLLSALIYWLLGLVSVLLAFAWLVIVLYLTLGFRQFSHHFSATREALEAGDEDAARAALARWQNRPAGAWSSAEMVRAVIEHAALEAHRHVLGVMVCFVALSLLGLGPAGAVLYRAAEFLSRHWQVPPAAPGVSGESGVPTASAPSQALQDTARRAWQAIDLLPSRATALAFAMVGHFEESIAAWRQDAPRYARPNDGAVLAATAGAINVRLRVDGVSDSGAEAYTSEGREPQLAHLASIVGLVWRSVVMWLLLMALMLLARVVG